MNEKALKRSRFLYFLESAFDYLIAVFVSGSFFATITKQLGISDSLTGILSSVISLSCLLQLLSVTLQKKYYKTIVTVIYAVSQLLFMLFYVIPITPLNKNVKIAAFIVVFLIAYFIRNFISSKKTNWYMSLIDDSRRGRYNAVNTIISLIMEMVFTFGMGAVIDRYKAQGRIRTAFVVSAAVIFVLMILHTLTMVFSVEKENEITDEKSVFSRISGILKEKSVLKVAGVFVLWQMASYAAIPFYGTYQIGELGFSLKYVSVLTVVSGILGILSSYLLGAYADKHSFIRMIRICFAVMCLGFVFTAFAVPGNGKLMFTAYYVCRGFAYDGIGYALMNLIYDYVPTEKRADSLALSYAVAGACGFITTVAVGLLVSHIQKNGNTFLGFGIYAQQVTSILAVLLTVCVILYTIMVPFGKKKKG